MTHQWIDRHIVYYHHLFQILNNNSKENKQYKYMIIRI
jgi:hypothetical protein